MQTYFARRVRSVFVFVITGILVFHQACGNCRAEDSSLIQVITTPNQIGASSELIQIQQGEIVARIDLGRSVVYGATSRELFALGYKGQSFQARVWKKSDGSELKSVTFETLDVAPIMGRIAATSGLELDIESNQLLYAGFKQVESKKTLGNRRVVERTGRWALAGISLSSGEVFEIQSPEELSQGMAWSPFKNRWGAVLKDGRFILLNSEKRSLDPDQVIESMGPNTRFVDGVGVCQSNNQRIERLTDVALNTLPVPEVVCEMSKGQYRFRTDAEGVPIVIQAVQQEKQALTFITVTEALSRKQISQFELPIALNQFDVSIDGSVFLVVDVINKHAIRFNSRTGTSKMIDYSRFELPAIFVNLEPIE